MISPIVISTRNERSKLVADLWKQQYFRDGEWQTQTALSRGRDSKTIYDGIVAAASDPDAIDIAIGNTSWTEAACHQCKQFKDPLAVLGDDDNFVQLCEACLRLALDLISEGKS
jgi:hypothetical protein